MRNRSKSKSRVVKESPGGIDGYLASVPPKARAALERLRRIIKAAAPDAEETISYGMPAFRYQGRLLVSFASFKGHCSFFPMNVSLISEHKDLLEGYGTSKGTIRFVLEKPLPAALVRRMVKARMRENERKARSRPSARGP